MIEEEILELTERLLESVASQDWHTYVSLCEPELTAFEPEARGHLVEGLEFHRFYFGREPQENINTTLSSPHVRMLGEDAALIMYVRLVQVSAGTHSETHCFEETRVWQKIEGQWKHVHFHRSKAC